jgi:FkbM family methyltransferase
VGQVETDRDQHRNIRDETSHPTRPQANVLRQIDYPGRLGGVDLFMDLEILMRKTTSPVMFDIGANVGQTVARLLEISPSASIHAFEPSPASFAHLEAAYGPVTRVHLENVALGDTGGFAECHLAGHSVNDSLLEPRWDFAMDVPVDHTTRDGGSRVPVKLTTLDKYCSERAIESIQFLKIDAQGYDLRVLRGASSMLTAQRVDAVAVELTLVPMYKDQGHYIEILSFLDSFGYRLMGFYEQTYRDNRFIYCNALFVG